MSHEYRTPSPPPLAPRVGISHWSPTSAIPSSARRWSSRARARTSISVGLPQPVVRGATSPRRPRAAFVSRRALTRALVAAPTCSSWSGVFDVTSGRGRLARVLSHTAGATILRSPRKKERVGSGDVVVDAVSDLSRGVHRGPRRDVDLEGAPAADGLQEDGGEGEASRPTGRGRCPLGHPAAATTLEQRAPQGSASHGTCCLARRLDVARRGPRPDAARGVDGTGCLWRSGWSSTLAVRTGTPSGGVAPAVAAPRARCREHHQHGKRVVASAPARRASPPPPAQSAEHDGLRPGFKRGRVGVRRPAS